MRAHLIYQLFLKALLRPGKTAGNISSTAFFPTLLALALAGFFSAPNAHAQAQDTLWNSFSGNPPFAPNTAGFFSSAGLSGNIMATNNTGYGTGGHDNGSLTDTFVDSVAARPTTLAQP